MVRSQENERFEKMRFLAIEMRVLHLARKFNNIETQPQAFVIE